jgi:hypothetical protein
VTAKNHPVYIWLRTLGHHEIADLDQQEDRNNQIVRYVGIPGLKYGVIVRIDAADLSLRANRMIVVKMDVEKTCVRVMIILLMLMEMLKRCVHERERQHEERQNGSETPHMVILHTAPDELPVRTPAAERLAAASAPAVTAELAKWLNVSPWCVGN